jgi:hypothetical protein
MKQSLGCPRMSAFELSKVGATSTPRRAGHFEIDSMLFIQSASAGSAALKVSAGTGRDGRLTMGFSWQEGVLMPDMMEQIKAASKVEIEILVIPR